MEEKRYWYQRREAPDRTRRITRRRLIQGTALGSAGLAATALIGCGRREQPRAQPETPAVPQPKRGGTLVRRNSLGNTIPFDAGLDPHPLQATYTSLMTQFYQTLLRLHPRTLAVEPEIAQRWEQPSETVYLFRLHPGIRWHNKPPANGRALTADDVVFSLNRVRTDDPRFQNRLLLSSIERVEAVDKATVRVTTKRPDVSTLTNLAAFSVAILAPEVVEKAGKFSTPDTAVGTGAFMLQELDDTHSLVVRNPDYWKPGLPYLDSVRNQYFGDDSAVWAAFLAKQIDVASNPVPGPEAKKLFEEQEGKPYFAEWYKDVSYTPAQPNTRRKPFDDIRVSRAIRLLLDHEEASHQWAVTWFGRGYVCSYLPAALEEWDFTEQEYVARFLEYKRPKDEAVREALRLLAAAGFSRDNPLKFTLTGGTSPFSQAMSQLFQAQVNRFAQGVAQITDLRLLPLAQLNNVQAQGDFDYTLSNQVAPQPHDPDSWFTTFYYTNGGRNNGKMSDPRLDSMIDRQRDIFNLQERKAFVKEMLAY
ncbi:MAG TPA: ABC transporter substrate-binding protein, partial [Dehalococcoidia bacterium]|nr:ABC transporter substrate-binding protein [Dehalococcoidia bacterium]